MPKCRAHLEASGSQAAFSTEVIDFGDVLQGESSHHFVILYNLHPNQKLKFKFEQTGLTWADKIVLEPKQGELKAASHQNIKMSLIPGTYPVHFEGEIQCTIEWEEPMGQEQGGKQADLKS